MKENPLASSQLQLCDLALCMSDIGSLIHKPKHLVKDISIVYFGLSVEGFVGHETDEKILVKAACGSGLAVAHSE